MLTKMTLPHVMRTEKLTTTEALEFTRNKSTKLTEQAPKEYREEIHRREYLHNAFIGCPWAQASLTASVAQD